MTIPERALEALIAAGVQIQTDVSLAPRVYWKCGGTADAVVDVESLAALQAVQRVAHAHELPVLVLGKGSNVLVADTGVRGIVVRLGGALADIEPIDVDGVTRALRVGAGLPLVKLTLRAKANAWVGLGCFAGIPGTIGGAVRMNAGSTLGETVEPLVSVTVVHRSGEVEEIAVADLRMAYRTCHLPDGSIVASARLALGDPTLADQDQARIQEFLARRKATQPLHLPSCGSTFANPPGDSAGRLIDVTGLKGFRVGDAQVSDKHANFVVNLGSATSADVRRVIEHVQAEVERQHGVTLHTEVHFVGDW